MKKLKTGFLCKILFKYLTLLALSFLILNCSQRSPSESRISKQIKVSEQAININLADSEELQKLPNIGQKTAEKIIQHRNKFGEFRKAEHIMLVEGISDKRFRKMRGMIKVK